ncbi:type IV toxin-antitoxin system YeeU family antitoxin [Yersinia massiliensis]|uniref:type IV toxin-antitoxin system YeeU family antitoxin n=1 Tax=Yersinia massiliensis TaxID=419257 RepID=UPI00119F34EA|nr:type IV toxin-antitoxin system YeeU family antitoxin [Yersinia massiliensis]
MARQSKPSAGSGDVVYRHHQQCITVRHGGFICDADTLGSYGYLYIAAYQERS